MPVSFHDLSFGGIGPGWSRVGATGHERTFKISAASRPKRSVPASFR
jgi:hypothetical protein